MRMLRQFLSMNLRQTRRANVLAIPLLGFALAIVLVSTAQVEASDVGRTFLTPQEAVSALSAAANAMNRDALRDLFGLATDDLVAADQVQASNELAHFVLALNQTNRLVPLSATKKVLEVGPNSWPFPIPIVQTDNRWHFDTDAGKEELVNRRIGRNELDTLRALRACVAAQREYATRDRDGDEVLEYARRLISTPGLKDGLFWSPNLDGELSPLGPLIAQAQGVGYRFRSTTDDSVSQPYHGYLYRVLTRQGSHAPGGSYSYLINGNMIGGFALIAWPAQYGESGIMTFIVNQQGRVYQKDLGTRTGKVAARVSAYDPGPGWSISPD